MKNPAYGRQSGADADSSTIAIGGWTKNTPKSDLKKEKNKKIIQNAKTQKSIEICQN